MRRAIQFRISLNENYKMDILTLGDCLTEMDNIPDNSIDLILCDLPYGMTAGEWDKIINFTVLWKQYNRVIKEGGTCCLFACQPFTTKLISSNIDNFRYCWYWNKNQGTNFFHAKSMPIRKVEEICVFYKGGYYPQMTDGHEPTNSAKGSSPGNCYHGSNTRNYEGGSTLRYPTNILEYDCVSNYSRNHPNEKPVDLLKYLIKTYTKEGDLVLDNCAGSGSTLVAAKELNRRYIGIEKEKKYYDIAMARLK